MRPALISCALALLSATAHAAPAVSSRAPARTDERGTLTVASGRQIGTRIRTPAAPPKRGPATQAPERYPAALILSGLHRPTEDLDLILADAPVVLASLEYPYEGEKHFAGIGVLKKVPALKEMAHDTLGAIRELGLKLREHPSVDPERILLVGVSLGVPFSILALERNPDLFRGAALVHGFADLDTTAAFHIERTLKKHLWTPLVEPAAWLSARILTAYLGLPSPEERLAELKASQTVLLISAESDRMVPVPARESLRRAIASSPARSQQRLLGHGHVSEKRKDLIAEICSAVEEWMVGNGWIAGD